MSGVRWSRNRSPIGIDLGSACLRAIQLERGGGGLRVRAVARQDLPEHDSDDPKAYHQVVAGLIHEMLGRGGFSGRHVVSCLPMRVLHCKNLRLPKMPASELAEVVRWDAADRLRQLGDTMATQFLDAGEVHQGEEVRHEIILLAAPERFVDLHVESYLKLGLHFEAIEATPTSLARVIASTKPSDPRHHEVAVELGATGTRVVITQPGRVRFFKNIEIGSQAIDGVVAHRLHVSLAEAAGVRQAMCNPTLMQANMTKRIGERTLDDESLRRDVEHAMRAPLDDLAREIALCLRYFSVTFRTRRPDHARVFGNLADDPLLHKTLAHEAGLTTEVADPFELSGVDASNVADRIDDSPLLWSVALGTAMRGMYVPAVGRRAA